MAAKSNCAESGSHKVKDCCPYRLSYVTIGALACTILYYLWRKCCDLVVLTQHNDDQGWWILRPFSSTDQPDVNLNFTAPELYLKLLSLIREDISYIVNTVHLFLYSITYQELFVGLSLVVVTTGSTYFLCYRTKSCQHDKKENLTKGEKSKEHVYSRTKASKSAGRIASIPDGRESTRFYWKWVALLVFVAFLLSIPWEFVRLYQTMVAEKVAQVTVGIPPECVPDQMSLTQSLRSWLRWHFSWTQDPCLQYHKALLVDPMWQVSPLMVISSAISHCIVYPVEVLLGGLGRSFRIFFTEIPAAWQPVMMLALLVNIVIILVMAFGYRVHLPFILKFEPKTPVIVRHKERKCVAERKKAEKPAPVESSQDTGYEGSQDSQMSLETSYSQF